jgi:pimeloyl-ACP methyl ester carboxylesterase
MPTRHAIPVTDDDRVVAVHHDPAAAGADDGPRGTDAAADRSDTWLVFCHGFLSDKSGSYEGRCQRAAEEGYHAVRFDFRGCGEADGAFVDQTLSDKIADLLAVVAFFDPQRLVLFGSSFGGKVAFHAAPDIQSRADRDLRAVATRAPVTFNRAFADARAAVEHEGRATFETGQSVDERFVDDLDKHTFEGIVGQIDCPVMMIHGADDESVAVEDSLEAAALLDTDLLLEKVEAEGHRFSAAGEARLRTRLFDWLASLDGE